MKKSLFLLLALPLFAADPGYEAFYRDTVATLPRQSDAPFRHLRGRAPGPLRRRRHRHLFCHRCAGPALRKNRSRHGQAAHRSAVPPSARWRRAASCRSCRGSRSSAPTRRSASTRQPPPPAATSSRARIATARSTSCSSTCGSRSAARPGAWCRRSAPARAGGGRHAVRRAHLHASVRRGG